MPPVATAESERILLLECRLENVCSTLAETRADADRLRGRLAETAAWEADHARRYSVVHQELAEARSEIASLHERLNCSEALRAGLEGNLFEAGSHSDAGELVHLRQELLGQRQRSQLSEQTAARLRVRVDELLRSRDTLFSRLAEWQLLVQRGDPQAIDLGEFIAELRQDILVLEDRNAASERRQMALRELLARAGVDPDDSLEEDAAFAAVETPAPVVQRTPQAVRPAPQLTDVEPAAATFEGLLSFAGGPSKTPEVFADAVVAPPASAPDAPLELPALPAPAEALSAADPAVRAAAYGQLSRALEDSPSQLADQLRSGLSDDDPLVRRRAVLAAATSRNLAVRPLLDPLRDDPDPHVRRVVRQVLRNAPDVELNTHHSKETTVGSAPGTR